jgi:hypothetical protein
MTDNSTETVNVFGASLCARQLKGGLVEPSGSDEWRLAMAPNAGDYYCGAQLDDYMNLNRRNFPWEPPVTLDLRARVSASDLPGTWGFGFWNDPFSIGMGTGGLALRIPALPNTAWFFYASDQNYLSLRDDLPASGLLASTFQSPRIPTWLLVLGAPFVPMLLVQPAARLLRKAVRSLIRQSARRVQIDVTQWHHYHLEWRRKYVAAWIDDKPVLETRVSPLGPLGLVFWIDNQYASFPSTGKFSIGTLHLTQTSWLELAGVSVTR